MLKALIYVGGIFLLFLIFASALSELISLNIAHWCSCEPFPEKGGLIGTLIISGILLLIGYILLSAGMISF